MSRVGKLPVVIPAGVDVSFNAGLISVKGTGGTLQLAQNSLVKIANDAGKLSFQPANDSREANAMAGTLRQLVGNMVTGVSKGFEKYLMDRARAVIRSVRIEVIRHEVTHKTPLFVRDPSAGPREQGYVSMRRLRTDADMARERVVAEFAAAGAALKRARAIAAVLDVAGEIDGLILDVDRVRDRVLEPASTQPS